MNKCQIHCLNEIAEQMDILEVFWQRRNRFKRILKRRWRYLINWFSESAISRKRIGQNKTINSPARLLQAGDMVQVRSKEEIQATLNRWDQLKGCSFMEEMWPYCGTTQRVLKRIEKFFDERDYLLKRCKGVVILEGVFCEGTKDFGPCDRTCFYFWREEWVEKIS